MLLTRRADLTERGRSAALRVADLVQSLGPDTAGRPVPGMEWSAIETAVHVVNLYGRGLGDSRRSESPEATAALNRLCLAEVRDRDPATVADRIAGDAVKVWDEVLPLLPDDLEVPFHAGTPATVVPIMGVLLAEMLVHGDDIARASNQPWTVGDDDAWCALRAMVVLLPAWRRAGVDDDAAAADTVAIVGPDATAMRISCAPHDTVVTFGPPCETDRIAPEPPSHALLGLFGRRPSAPPLADLVARFGPF